MFGVSSAHFASVFAVASRPRRPWRCSTNSASDASTADAETSLARLERAAFPADAAPTFTDLEATMPWSLVVDRLRLPVSWFTTGGAGTFDAIRSCLSTASANAADLF